MRGARVASALFVGAGVIVMATLPLAPAYVPRLQVAVMGSIAVAVGFVVPRLPWSRWGMRPLVALPVLGYVLLTITGLLAPGVLALYISLYSFTFVYLGLLARPGLPMRLLPVAIVSYVVGVGADLGSQLAPLLIAAPVWCLIGELLARALSRHTHELERIAETDPLTSLGNRRSYERALHLMEPGDALVLLDLDRFKMVNDVHGHHVGDTTLKQLAAAMSAVTRPSDYVARYGGEEFAMVLARAGTEGSQEVLRRLCHLWATAPTTFSAGIAIHRKGEEPTATLERADAALYEAKARGRSRIEIAPSDMPAPQPLHDTGTDSATRLT